MKRLALALALLAAVLPATAAAQSSTTMKAEVVATCGTKSLTAGKYAFLTLNLLGVLCGGAGGSGGGSGGSSAVVTPLADVTVTNASTVVVAADPTRTLLLCVNSGGQNVRVGSATTAPTATTGVQIRPGGTYSTLSTAGINAISETATSSTFSCTKETTS